MSKIISILIAIVLILGGVYLYATRPIAAPSDMATTTASTTASNISQTGTAAVGNRFVIVPSKSYATFELDETLSGKPKHVVGTTTDVSGSFVIDAKDLSKSSASQIKVNARALKTDSTSRDGAMGRFILKSEAYQYITFDVKDISAVPANPEIGKDYQFEVRGDLAIAGVSRQVAWTVTAKADSTTQISGVARTTVNRKDFSLDIPNIPFVANVSDTVALTFSFVAQK